jgi:hypothetical protein
VATANNGQRRAGGRAITIGRPAPADGEIDPGAQQWLAGAQPAPSISAPPVGSDIARTMAVNLQREVSRHQPHPAAAAAAFLAAARA